MFTSTQVTRLLRNARLPTKLDNMCASFIHLVKSMYTCNRSGIRFLPRPDLILEPGLLILGIFLWHKALLPDSCMYIGGLQWEAGPVVRTQLSFIVWILQMVKSSAVKTVCHLDVLRLLCVSFSFSLTLKDFFGLSWLFFCKTKNVSLYVMIFHVITQHRCHSVTFPVWSFCQAHVYM